MGSYIFGAPTGKHSQTQAENQTCCRHSTHPLQQDEYRANMHWGVAFITARAGVRAMMMGSLPDDQLRQHRFCIGEANVQSVLKHNTYHSCILIRSSNIISCPLSRNRCSGIKCPRRMWGANHLQSQPPPLYTLSPAPNLNIGAAKTHRCSSITSSPAPAPAPPHLLCVCFSCLSVSPRESKRAKISLQKTTR